MLDREKWRAKHSPPKILISAGVSAKHADMLEINRNAMQIGADYE